MTIDLIDKELVSGLLKEQAEELKECMDEKHSMGSIGLTLGSSATEFYITFSDFEWLDGELPCFGRVYPYVSSGEAFTLLKNLELAPTLQQGRPNQVIRIVQCGQM